jgi:hypothetical protein
MHLKNEGQEGKNRLFLGVSNSRREVGIRKM